LLALTMATQAATTGSIGKSSSCICQHSGMMQLHLH
jgi:hypothetical protein